MQVKATKPGFYRNVYRYPGDIFMIGAAADFSSRWMERVGPGEPEKEENKKPKSGAFKTLKLNKEKD